MLNGRSSAVGQHVPRSLRRKVAQTAPLSGSAKEIEGAPVQGYTPQQDTSRSYVGEDGSVLCGYCVADLALFKR